jgi:alpha-1,2-mannosyltransferase
MAVVLAAALGFLAYYAVAWLQVSPLRERGTDFSASYVAALLVRDGEGSRLYDQPLEHERHLALLPSGTRIDLPFIAPPTAALLAVPFSFLDPGMAFRLWSLVQMALLALAVAIAARASPWPPWMPAAWRRLSPLAGFAGTATFSFFILGQVDGIAALGLAAAYASWRHGHAGRAGFWLMLGFAVTKPHLAIGLAAFLVGRRDARALAGGAFAVGLAVVAALAVDGGAAITGFAGAAVFALGNTPAASTAGLSGFIASWLGDGTGPAILTAVGASLAVIGCGVLGARARVRPGLLEIALGGAVALSLVASPHLLTHDLVLLAPVFVWTMARAASQQAQLRLLGAWVTLNMLVALDTGNGAPAPPGRLTPLALVAAGAAAMLASAELRRRTMARFALQTGGGSGAGGSTE